MPEAMSEWIIDEEVWQQMTEIERIEVVRQGRATLRQLRQGLLDGSDELGKICREFLAHTGTALEELRYDTHLISRSNSLTKSHDLSRHRGGLPKDFVARRNRQDRTHLLEENIYRLPDGHEFVPCKPDGRLGGRGHQYALLTRLQYEQQRRGSVYVRNDGRIFDYSNANNLNHDLFDTGFRIEDLERTGHYADRAVKRVRQKKR